MKKIKKLILIPSLLINTLITSTLVSCINTTESSELRNKIPTGFEVNPITKNNDEIRTKEILNKLLKLTFKEDKIKKTNFLNSQNNDEILLSNLKELSKKLIESIKNGDSVEKLIDFYSQNWFFVLKNIDKLKWKFLEWWKFDEYIDQTNKKNNAKHSKEFLDKLERLSNPNDHIFINNYFDDLIEGGESAHYKDKYVYYLKKDKLIIRLLISKNNENEVTFDRIIFFPRSLNNKIIVKLISDAIHNGILHHNQQAYNDFEKAIIGNYNEPGLGVLVTNEKIK
ncbi:aromatic motif membrane protein [Metamycoplasma alkalescens]|uniref:Aromatic cluster surface protein n=1 Tax=Metamycoplasma alkalescens TaxID=45363 RepID=A0A318U8H7_9BACT|nr:aromatic motif membrane protein [Metamycoplasma alkalescens]PYF43714.1 aromatic cluster surface protein [Metamycoplasma alkalescens]